jgi:hypothetical protein
MTLTDLLISTGIPHSRAARRARRLSERRPVVWGRRVTRDRLDAVTPPGRIGRRRPAAPLRAVAWLSSWED